MTSSLSQALSKLTASDLELAPVQRLSQNNRQRTTGQLENLIDQIKKKGNDPSQLQKQLLLQLLKENNVTKVNELVQQLEAENFTFANTTLAHLMQFYSDNGDIDKALHYKDMLETKYPDYRLYNLKLIHLAQGLINADRFDAALDLFKKYTSDESNFFVYNTKCWQVLNELAEKKETAKVSIFVTLIRNFN